MWLVQGYHSGHCGQECPRNSSKRGKGSVKGVEQYVHHGLNVIQMLDRNGRCRGMTNMRSGSAAFLLREGSASLVMLAFELLELLLLTHCQAIRL